MIFLTIFKRVDCYVSALCHYFLAKIVVITLILFFELKLDFIKRQKKLFKS